MARLGVNVDGIALLRELGGVVDADPVKAAICAEIGGADGILCSLDESLKPIGEKGIRLLKEMVQTHLTIRMVPMEKLMNIILTLSPDMVTLIPGKKPGATQGGGLDVMGQESRLVKLIREIRSHDIIVNLLIEPIIHQVKAASKIGADYIEIHTGRYAQAQDLNERSDQLENISSIALAAIKMNMGVTASCGLDYHNVSAISSLESIEEINIGEAILARALWMGMEQAVRDMAGLIH